MEARNRIMFTSAYDVADQGLHDATFTFSILILPAVGFR
jgi:hypothetical protein